MLRLSQDGYLNVGINGLVYGQMRKIRNYTKKLLRYNFVFTGKIIIRRGAATLWTVAPLVYP